MLDHALAYAALGWHVVPLHTPKGKGCDCNRKDCDNIGKHPRTRNGLKDATTDEATVRALWGKWPHANIGVVCGPSGIVGIDIDPRHGGDESYLDLIQKHGKKLLTETVSASTGGGGEHYIFAAPRGEHISNVSNSQKFVGPLGVGVDVRAGSGYIVVAPSLHASGSTYSWQDGYSPFDRQPALLPHPLFELLSSPAPSGEHTSVSMKDILAGVPEGQRDWELFRAAAKLRYADVPVDMALRLITEAAANCIPPFPQSEAIKKVKSAYDRYEAGKAATLDMTPAPRRADGNLFVWANELDTLPELEWLIDGFAQAGAFGALVGQHGSFKSFLLGDMAGCISTGKLWHGREVKKGKVLYAFGEGLRGLKHRVHAWEQSNGVKMTDVAFVPRAIQMLNHDDVDYLLERIRVEMDQMPVAIFIDTLARAMAGGDENSQKDMGLFVEAVDRLIRETGAAVWVAHHVNKQGEYRGSTALPGAVDTMAMVVKKGDKLVQVTCDKIKDAEPFDPIDLVLTPYGTSLAVESPSTWQITKEKQRKLSERALDTLAALARFGPQGARYNDWYRASGLNDNTFDRTRTALVDAEKVVNEGGFYKVAEEVTPTSFGGASNEVTPTTDLANSNLYPHTPTAPPRTPNGGSGGVYPHTPTTSIRGGGSGGNNRGSQPGQGNRAWD